MDSVASVLRFIAMAEKVLRAMGVSEEAIAMPFQRGGAAMEEAPAREARPKALAVKAPPVKSPPVPLLTNKKIPININ